MTEHHPAADAPTRPPDLPECTRAEFEAQNAQVQRDGELYTAGYLAGYLAGKKAAQAEAEDQITALRAALQQLEVKWRDEGARIDAFHATMGTGYAVCADELAFLLSRVPEKEKTP